MADMLVWTSFAILFYVYVGYKRVLQIAVFFFRKQTYATAACGLPTLTVLLTAHNEAGEISDRLYNILDSIYPSDQLEILVASDGSTDGTDDIVTSFNDSRVRLFRPEQRAGKTETQNLAIPFCRGDIVVFTDAGTRFDKKFLSAIAAPFSDANVGAVDGHLQFVIDHTSGVAQGQGYYWNYELGIRQLESNLGILAVASGACLAVRKNLFIRMDPSIGEDCIVPLDVVSQGYKIIHASDALAFDQMDSDSEKEFKTRVRMTLRNWQGTWSRKALLYPISYLGYAFALWSHKILRWLSPFFLCVLTFSTLITATNGTISMKIIGVGLLVFYAASLIGWWLDKNDKHFPLAHIPYSFMLANAGFLIGVLKALAGRKIYNYR